MTEINNVVVVQFKETSTAYQALSVLKECDAEGRIVLQSAAVVERTAEGELRIPDSTDSVGLDPAPDRVATHDYATAPLHGRSRAVTS
jgi:uncharacterized membrane protein